MGKRSRKRASGPVRASAEPTAAPAAPRRVARPKGRLDRFIQRAEERPKPPWHPVPLVELSVLVGIVLLVVGLLNYESDGGRLAVLFGVALASLAGLDTAVRDHFAGFRSHSTLLASLPAVVAVVALALAGAPYATLPVVALSVFAAAFWWLRRAFRRRAGVPFKV